MLKKDLLIVAKMVFDNIGSGLVGAGCKLAHSNCGSQYNVSGIFKRGCKALISFPQDSHPHKAAGR